MAMVKVLVAALLLAAVAAPGKAQKFEISPFLGFQVGGTIEGDRRDLDIDESANYGAVFSLRTRHDGLVEILFSRQDTTVEFEDDFGNPQMLDIYVDYLHFSGLWEIRGDKTRPFITLSVGATHLDPQESGVTDEWLFSGAISGGGKIYFSERVGLRVEGRGLLTLSGSGGAIFCGFPPGGCAVSVSGSPIIQFNVLTGLIFAF